MEIWKKLVFGMIFLIVNVSLVSAYHNGFAHNPHGTRIVFGFDGDFYSQDYRYVDYYGTPLYRVYGVRSNFKDDDFWKRVNRQRAVNFAVNSFNDRYFITSGKSSAQAFCPNCKSGSVSSSDWGNKQAYNFLAEGSGGRNNYYYKQNFDSNLGKFNWRF